MDNPAEAAPTGADLVPAKRVEVSPLERAAITLLSMGEEAAAAVMRCLSREELLEVTRVMSGINGVKVDAVQETLQMFFDAYREQSGVNGASRAYLQRSLDLALGSAVANSVLNGIYGDVIGPKMQRLEWAQPQWLAERLAREHVRMQAIFLAFLKPEQASQVIAALPEAQRERVVLQIARLKEIDHELLQDLEAIVDACLENLGSQSAAVEGVRQAAEILNRLPGNRAQLIEVLREADPDATAQIEDRVYSIDLLTHQSAQTISAILAAVPFESWGVALKGTEPSLREALSRAMPRRQVQAFEDMLKRTGPLPMSRIDSARREIMEQVRDMAEAGEIELQLYTEEVVE
ncbi:MULTISPECIES: FliG C-terminal domain-containing protein [Pseudoxanthomonas]|jgi:Flagellar motor switch protein|uniref:Flagellar motor switch protein FliG n=1 Tax=Pseudoxanthomonas taiwanensis J19 TaxID=935569 RepID=A0A562E4F7_9GAMM|nr:MULTISPECIES: FliG C-terminal domain-containing protein [Pseudoxanthomonas]RRN81044.1 flagellar motor switch protein FliG [Pseudoxanthomonas sp. SGD-10]TWH16710.1 flagellar motor switch protein FliG [Pseudoxanthomonas taiwanensis J19]